MYFIKKQPSIRLKEGEKSNGLQSWSKGKRAGNEPGRTRYRNSRTAGNHRNSTCEPRSRPVQGNQCTDDRLQFQWSRGAGWIQWRFQELHALPEHGRLLPCSQCRTDYLNQCARPEETQESKRGTDRECGENAGNSKGGRHPRRYRRGKGKRSHTHSRNGLHHDIRWWRIPCDHINRRRQGCISQDPHSQ